MQETKKTRVRFLVWEDPQEEDMAIHSSILAWRIPWTEEPGRLRPIGSQRVGHDWSNLAHPINMELILDYHPLLEFIHFLRRVPKGPGEWRCGVKRVCQKRVRLGRPISWCLRNPDHHENQVKFEVVIRSQTMQSGEKKLVHDQDNGFFEGSEHKCREIVPGWSCCFVCVLSRVWLCATLWTVAR